MPKAQNKSVKKQRTRSPDNGSDQSKVVQEGEPKEPPTQQKKETSFKSTVQGLLKAAKPQHGERPSVLSLPSDFGSPALSLRDCCDAEYDNYDVEADPPQPFDCDYDYEPHDSHPQEGMDYYDGAGDSDDESQDIVSDDLFDTTGQMADLLAEQGEGPAVPEDIAALANKI